MTGEGTRLAGRVAIVTGGGRGIGRAIALALAREGAAVVVAARTAAEVKATSEAIEAEGGRALAVPADVADLACVERLEAEARTRFGGVDILVNNAGIQGPIGPAAESPPEVWARTIAVNLLGSFYCARAVLPGMIARRRGKIINLSGGGATAPRPFFSAYAASKAALVRWTETLAAEVRPHGIDVNAIAPGAVHTRMAEEVLAAGPAAGEAALEQARRQRETGGVPPERAAALAVFLASPASDGLTGRLISVFDPWERMTPAEIETIMASDLYTLRRVQPAPAEGGGR
jgi:3-oxoacyl-[acyl-carrier protein] reductase